MADEWIDEIAAKRAHGINTPLSQSAHGAVNARYPGLTVKRCPVCDEAIDDAQSYCSEECEEEYDG